MFAFTTVGDSTPRTDIRKMEELNQNDINTSDDCDSNSSDESPKTFQNRLEDMPAYNMTVSNLQSMYTTLKGTNGYLSSFLDMGESVAGATFSVAKPVVMAATDVALMVAKPVVGEVRDPVASIDGCAAEVLGKVQEKLPFVKQYPAEVVEAAKSSAKDTASYYYEKMQGLTVTQNAVQQLTNAVAFSDLAVELCLPTDGSNIDDMRELEKEEGDEDKGVLVHAMNVKTKACRRGRRKLMSYRSVRTTVNMVQYAQACISETTEKLIKGTNYTSTTTPTEQTSQDTPNEVSLAEEMDMETEVTGDRHLTSEGWDIVYKSSMYIPTKALQVTGEVFVSTKEMVFKYSNAQTIKEMPQAITEMAESCYNNINQDGVSDVKDKAIAFAYVPAQVLSNYVQSNRLVQWILPAQLQTHKIQVMQNDETAN